VQASGPSGKLGARGSDSYHGGRPGGSILTGVRYLVLVGLCLLSLIVYVHRNSLGVAEKEIRADLGLSEKAMGVAMGAFFATYAAGQLPGGWLAHRYGSRCLLPLLCVVGSAATVLLGLAGGLGVLLLARLAMGTAQAGMFPCATDTFAKWFPPTQRAVASGFLAGAMSVGGALGAFLTGWFLPEVGWRGLFLLYALPGFAWAAGFYAWFRDRPQDYPRVGLKELAAIGVPVDQAGPHEPMPWVEIVRSPALAWICGQQFLRAGGYMFYSTWFATYLRETRGVSLQGAGVLTSLPLLAFVCGSLSGGLVSDWLLTRSGSRRVGRQGVAVASQFACSLFVLLARPVGDAWSAVLLISAGSFCAAMGGPCAYAITIDMGGRYVAPVFSTMNMAGNVGAMLFPVIIPWLVGDSRDWDLVLYVFAAIHAGAAACWTFLNPEGTIVPDKEAPACPT
jgi:sugar phosphate permease